MIKINTKSIRFKILSLFAGALFVTVFSAFTFFFIITKQIIFQQVDNELKNHAGKFAQSVEKGTRLTNIDFGDTPGMVVTILDRNGSEVQSSLSLDSPFVSYSYIFQSSKNSQGPIFVNQSMSNMPMRLIAQPVWKDNNLLGIVLVAHPIDAIQKSLNQLFAVLIVLMVFLILPIFWIADFLSVKIMKPIEEISKKMEDIGSENLDERVKTRKSGDEIEKLGRSFNLLLDRLSDSFTRERQFIGDVAHQLKTPIATAKGEMELALSKPRKIEEYKKALSEALYDIDKLSGITKNILDLAWIKSENTVLKKFDLSEMTEEISEIGSKLASQKHITFSKEISSGIKLTGSPEKLEMAILNIVDNAIKYTPKGGRVDFKVSKKGKKINIVISDNGIGIPKEELPHIFERFYRGSKGSKISGTGLGLAIAQRVVKAHSGDMTIKSKVGVGTTVSIVLINS